MIAADLKPIAILFPVPAEHEGHRGHRLVSAKTDQNVVSKKSRRGGTPWVFLHVGLLVNEPPGPAGLPFS